VKTKTKEVNERGELGFC